jgi:sigma-B regulation protein RsbU (phosphoserine phosphatase)
MSPSDARKATLTISNSIAELQKAVDFVENFGAAHNIPHGTTNDLNLCLDEILNNIVSYAYEDQSHHSIAVVLSLEDGWLIAETSDDGKPFNPWNAGPQSIEGTMQSRRIGGLGRSFVKSLMDEVDYERTSQYNVLTIKKKIVEA